ncbi:MAG TPA: FAD:protein FMN transferase [Vicinamibacterales bacterium]|jgi:thiamine biosynthesis lipoprotein
MPDAKLEGRSTRRRFLRVVAAVAGVPPLIAAVRATAPNAQLHEWHGEVLGAVSELSLWHPDAAFARRTILRVRQEIDRFERIFSLYRPDSEISRLNGAGRLTKPSRELRTLIEESQRLGELSGGAFDISVQPLWRLYEAHFWSHTDIQPFDGAQGKPDIAARARDVARAVVDYRRIDSGAAAVGFARAGMAITLNSIAQGYITDLIADMLRNEGFERAVVDLGEYRTIGHHPDGRPWRIGIRDGRDIGSIDGIVDLEDMALAVSGGYGTTFEESGRYHHIFDPRTGASANNLVDVAVIGPRATAADGLATAICVAGEALAPALLAAYPRTRAILTRLDGTSMTLTAKGPTIESCTLQDFQPPSF